MPPKTQQRAVQTPGEEKPQVAAEAETDGAPERVKTGTTELNNIVGQTANDVGADRENVVRAQAMADAARRGVAADLAPAADIGRPAQPTSTKREAIINGNKVTVDIPIIRRNDVVEKFGPEVTYPKGTTIRADGKPCEGNDVAIGVVADIDTPQGKLVNRVVKFDQLEAAK